MAKKAKPLKASASAAHSNVVVPLRKRPEHSTVPPRSESQVFKFRLRNGFTGQTIVRNEEIDRLWYRVQQPDDFHHVIVFDSDDRRMAINVRHLVASQFDLIGEDGLVAKDVDEGDFVEIYFSDSKKPLRLDVEEDAVTLDEFDESGIEGDDDLCQLANFLYYLEAAHNGSDDASRLRISDGSILWFRLNDIAFFSVPLRLLAKPGSEAAQILAGKD